jgi:hypothetical protein
VKANGSEAGSSVVVATAKEMGDGDKDYRAQRSRRQRIQKAASEKSKLHENPATDIGTDQAKYDVRNASEAPATRDFSGKPTGNETEEKPGDETVRLEPHSNGLLRKQVCGEHEASSGKNDCI